jgi:hypothetical protein
VKYLLLIYGNPESWSHPVFLRSTEALAMSDAERGEMSDQLESLLTELRESGELVAAEPLADPVNTRTVRVRDDIQIATDGPYLESKEQMAGFFVVDCATSERAEEIAGRFPDARFWAVELRPIMGSSGQEM